MKYKYSIFTSALLLGVSIVTSGCSGGGSSSGSGDTPPTATTATTAVTSVSGTTGSGTSTTSSTAIFSSAVPTTQQDYGTATLIVDSDGNGVLESSDTTYIVGIESDGSFSFDNVGVDEENEVKAQLTVEKEGYAPVVRTLTLSKDNPLSVLAKIGNIPVLTEVQTLPATAAERASSFLKFGITKSSTGVTSFSKLMTLSELRAEAKVSLGADTLSESVIPAAAFDSSVTTVTAKMQAFDSTKAEDIALFPGEFAGHGKSQVSASATTDTTDYPLESAAFDMIKLTDQNGDEITLQPITTSKFTSMATSADTCNGMFWTRRVTSEQAAVIEAWGDDDNDSSNGFQVPIWSNDNSTGSWEYLGLGDWNASTSSFSTCVDKKWQGYLNCDSQISFDKPKEICVAAVDQDGNPLGSISVQAKKGNSYSYQYLDGEGKGKLALTAGTPDEWEFTYDGSITGWSPVAIESANLTSSTTTGCDYDMSFTVDNPYSAKVYVYALDDNGKPIASAYVSLKSTNYSDYYSKSARTNAQGYAEFSVKPNVVYTAKYKAGTSAVNVNGTVADPETADSGKYASVSVKDQNAVPSVYVYTYQNRIKDTAQSLNFHVSASDANDDTLTLSSLTVNGTALTAGRDYIVERTSSYAGGYYLYGKLDLNSSTMSGITSASLSAGNYTISAVLSDGKTTGDDSTNFSVTANSAPTIGSVYLVDSSWNYYYENSVIPTGTYTVNAYIYDLDGDNVNKTISVDGVETASSVTLAQGDHNITINADDGNLSATKTISIYVGNHPPVITSAGATKFRVDVNAGEKFKLYAYAEDADRNSITVTAQDAAGNSYTLTRASSYTTKYVSEWITLKSNNLGDNSFTIVANDGEANSTLATVSVEAYAEDQKPIFTKELRSQNVNVNTSTTFECVAKDPEGTPVSYSWSLNGTAVATGTTYTNTFTKTGSNTLSCTATDAAGKTATSSATITVVDPTQTGTLTIHTGVENLKVSIHDVTTALVTQEKNTDANGDATFSIVGDRTTVSLTTWPGMEIGSGLLMSLLQDEVLINAHYSCNYSTTPPTECAKADWCALMDATTIPTWMWDAAAAYGTGIKMLASSEIDTNNDGSLSESELYTAALNEIDANNDKKITYSEFNGNDNSVDIQVDMFANIPVREYYIAPSGAHSNPEMHYMCSNTSFDANLTLHTDQNMSFSGTVSGSGYGGVYSTYPDSEGNINLPVSVYTTDSDHKYSFLLRVGPDQASEPYFYLLAGKTKAELAAGITINDKSLTAADKNVTFHQDTTVSSSAQFSYGIESTYKGVGVNTAGNGHYIDDVTRMESHYNNPAITYKIHGYITENILYGYSEKGHNGYYGGGILQSDYYASDYPMLDANIAFAQDGSWTLSGSDLSKVNNVEFGVETYGYDESTGTNYNVRLNINWTVAPTQMPDVNITAIMPSDIQDDVAKALAYNTGYVDMYVDVLELKGLNESEFIDHVAGSAAAITDMMYDDSFGVGKRYIHAYFVPSNMTAASTTATSHTRRGMKKPFTINYDVSKLFSK